MFSTLGVIYKSRQSFLPGLFYNILGLYRTITHAAPSMDILFSWFTRAEVAIGAHHSLTPPSSLTNSHSFRLLDLPPELVERIASFAGRESLMPLRSSCKALEAITFDRFATEYFEHIYCWAACTSDFRSLKQILYHSPRISSRIRHLTVTGRILDCPKSRGFKVALERRGRGETAPANTARSPYLPDIYCVGLLTVLRALQGIHRLP